MRVPPLFFLVPFIFLVSAWTEEFRVVPGKEDPAADGSASKPLRGLVSAKNFIRQYLSKNPGASPTVILGSGTYRLAEPLVFDERDSGAPGRPVIWRSESRREARISAGLEIPKEKILPVLDPAIRNRLPAPEAVREIDLSGLDLKNAVPFPDTFPEVSDGRLKVVMGEREMPIVRWPKNGYARMKEVVSMGLSRGEPQIFIYENAEPERWQLGNVWLLGWWRVEFASHGARLAKVDPSSHQIELSGWVPGGIGSKFHRPNRETGKIGSGREPWFAINVLEELREPGEWAIDFASQKIYLIPNGQPVSLCDKKAPLLQFLGASNIFFENAAIADSLDDGVALSNAQDIRLGGLELTRVRCGVRAYECRRVEVLSCDVHDVRETGIAFEYLENRSAPSQLRSERARNLEPSANRIVNNLIWNAAIGVTLGDRGFAVGDLAAHNAIHDISGMGLRYAGNEMRIESNELYNIGLLSGDVGAVYTTLRVTDRGNLVRANFIHHCPGVNAIYIDDGASGTRAVENVVIGAEVGGWISGGRENVVASNLFVDCRTAALHADDRGLSRGYATNAWMWKFQLESISVSSGKWAERYPDFAEALGLSRGAPFRDRAGDNIIVASPTEFRRKYSEKSFIECVWTPNLTSFESNDFVNLSKLDFRAKPATALEKDAIYRALPVQGLGLFEDAYRPQLPPPDPGRLIAKRHFGEENVSLKDMETSNKK